jgi:MFS transporter, PAT family, beta-lactamase induction signal transducer AmpG
MQSTSSATHSASETAPASGMPAWARFAALFVLYFVQGLPYGFQTGALPIYLREAGISLTGIGLVSALSLPWMLKILWAPMVDRWHVRRLGRRRSWILPMQLALALACAVAAYTEPESRLVPLLGLLLCMNLFAATMDIAVDGLAVDLLAGRSLGYANIAQVVGFKVGIITAGGVLLRASGSVGWDGMFGLMAGLVLVGFVVALVLREPASRRDAEPGTVREILALLRRALATPGVPWLLFFIASYKFGESMSDLVFRPFLVDAGFDREEIATWVNIYGMLGSLVGSTLGGLLAGRIGLMRGLAVTACLRALPLAGMLWLALGGPAALTADSIIAVTVAENFFGGALTTCMFAYMMSRVDPRIGATHFTLFATVEVVGKMVAGLGAGWVGDRLGYVPVFSLAVALSVAFIGLLVPMARHDRAAR